MAGYVRADVTDQIANGNTVDAVPLDGEFDAIQGAFAAVGGHRHNGTVGEGAPITVIGPTQDVVASANSLTPKTDNAIDLGSSSLEWKDLYIDGTANIDSLVADTADINAGTIDNTIIGATTPAAITATSITATTATVGGAGVTTATNTQTLTNKTINLTSNTLVATSAQLAAAVTDETGSGALVFATSPVLAGIPTAPTAAADTNTTQIATTAHVFAERSNVATLTNKTLTSPTITAGMLTSTVLSSPTITGGTINNTPIGATTRSSGAFTTLTANGQTSLDGTTQINSQLGLNGANYGTSGQVLTSAGPGNAPTWANSFPSGGIILWSGSIVSIPAGWALCDGTNGTPNLRDRFVVGAGSTYAVGATGGAASVSLSEANLPSHSHTFSGTTSADGAHAHAFDTGRGDGFGFSQPTGVIARSCDSTPTYSDYTTDAVGTHTHTFSGTTGTVGSGTAHENRPPYYALAYIMKL